LGAILDEAYASADPIDLNFKGFVFPRVDFRYTEFRGIADFRKTIFTDDADFRGALFRRPVDFHVAEFRKNAVFDSAKFENIARFAGVQFKGRAIFSRTPSITLQPPACYFLRRSQLRTNPFQQTLTFRGNAVSR